MKNKLLSTLIIHLNLGIFTFLLLSQTTSCEDPNFAACVPKNCGNQTIKYPFYIKGEQNSSCGFPGFDILCQKNTSIIRKPENDFVIKQFFYENESLHLLDTKLDSKKNICFLDLKNISLDPDKFEIPSNFSDLYLMSNCSSDPKNLSEYKIGCKKEHGYGMFKGNGNLNYTMGICKVVVLAKVELLGINDGIKNYLEGLKRGIVVNWIATKCGECDASGGRCGFNETSYRFQCFCRDRPHKGTCKSISKNHVKVILLTVLPGIVIIIMAILIIRYRKKWKDASVYISSRNISSDPFSKSDLGGDGSYLGVPMFSYAELEEATNNFDHSRELGDGGFGIVYYGKLRDGREVAVKRLYEHNYKRVAQFRNEIQILTLLRHTNLLTLYGCNSRPSRELLLVYEYVPNGTVSDHLYGDRTQDGPLTWPVRLSIAIQTANALSYLHKSDIIHRDVKTNNILLDGNFCVKVADFGISRLCPNEATHVSTAPQGMPGYLDPEYYQCYQLTDKSDVYSFGVVLIELVSSMPAIDINRRRYEVNLADLAMNKIRNNAFEDMIDSSLGFESDPSVERMVTSVVEVAFRCLQQEKEMRPSMDEVLDTLREIRDYKDDENGNNIDTNTAVLMKSNGVTRSPISVVDKWVSSCSVSSG